MSLESQVIPLEGEQAALFQGLEERERAIRAQLKPIQDERNAIVSGILAGKGLLRAVQETKDVALNVTPDVGITITVPRAIALVEDETDDVTAVAS